MPNFPKMRFPRQALTKEDCLKLLAEGDVGVLATVNKAGDPCATAVNYALLDNETLVFHSAKVGEKMDNMRNHANVTFFVIFRDKILEKEYTTDYKSVSVHGHVEILEGDAAYPYLKQMTKRLDSTPTDQEIYGATYPHFIGKVAVVLLHIDCLTGKVGEKSVEANHEKQNRK